VILGGWKRSGLDPVQYLANLNGHHALSTRRYYGRILKGFLRWSVKHQYLAANPLEDFHFPPPPEEPVAPFTDDELRRLRDACQTPYERVVIAILAETGMRISEVAALRPANMGSGTIHIQNAKGNKARVVALSSETETMLSVLGNGFNFGDTQAIRRTVKRIGARAGVSNVYPHRFRHSFACRALESGMDVLALQTLLGHSDLSMTRRYVQFTATERALAAHRKFLGG